MSTRNREFMKTCIKNLFLLLALIAGLGWILAGRVTAQTYTFGSGNQSTPSASITYNSGTGAFQYTDAANSTKDTASLRLTGTAAALITTSNGWTASLNVNIAARTMAAISNQSPLVAMGIVIIYNANQTFVSIALGQVNNTGGADDSVFPNGLYGTGATFSAKTNGNNDVTEPLGASQFVNGESLMVVSGETSASAASESINAVTGVLTLSYNALTYTVTGYYNGTPIGTYSPPSWMTNPPLTLGVFGQSGEGIAVLAGTATASNFYAGLLLPLQVTTFALPNGTNGFAYSQQLSAIHGQLPYSWSLLSGSLPSGLTLATNGVISGTPTANGTFNFTVKVTDALPTNATQALALTVGSPPSVVWIQPTNNSIAIMLGSNVSFAVSVAGTGPFNYQWQLNGANLPIGIITTVAGSGTSGYSGDGGTATSAELNYPYGVAVDARGNLFIADWGNYRIRVVGNNGIITTVAGGGSNVPGDGGAATNAELARPYSVAVDARGNLFIADQNSSIREVGTNGIITTVAGNGGYGYSGDGGPATNAELNFPEGVAVDATGNLFIVDSGNYCIRKVGTNGIINTVAGNGTNGYSGDGGAATNAELSYPYGMAVDATGNQFLVESGSAVICEVGTNGIINTVAGNMYTGYFGDGSAATNAELWQPLGVAVDATGNLFIADTGNNVIREVGINGIINTVAGNGTNGYSGDGGAATNAELRYPSGVAMDATGNLFIADSYNNVIRKVVNLEVPGPTLVLNDVGFGNAGAYDVVVSNPYGSVTSSVVHLTITLPPVVLSAPRLAGGRTNFTFLLSGLAGSNYVLQVSTNLLNWSSVSTSTIPVSGSITLSNAISGYNRRFYRVYLQ